MAQQANRALTVGYNTRGMASWRRIKQLRQINVTCCLDAQLLWQPVELAAPLKETMASSHLLNALLGAAVRPGAWRHNLATSGGMLVEVGTYVVDLVFWLANAPASAVVAWQQPVGHVLASVINAQFTLMNNVTVSLTFNDMVDYGDFNFRSHGRLTLLGDGGVLTAEWSGFMATEAQAMWIGQGGVHEQVEPLPTATPPVAAFVATVLDGLPNLAPAEEAAQTVALTEVIFDCPKPRHSTAVNYKIGDLVTPAFWHLVNLLSFSKFCFSKGVAKGRVCGTLLYHP